MRDLSLFDAVQTLANLSHPLSDSDMEQPWAWRAHSGEGARFALLGSYHELRDLAVTLATARARRGSPPSVAQRALAQYHEAYRDFQAVLIGAPVSLYDQDPAPGEWPLRYVIGHIARTERTFFALVHHGVERQREGGERAPSLPAGEADRLTLPQSEFMQLWMKQGMAEMLAWYDSHHERVLAEFASISDAEVEGTHLWWEGEEVSGQYRLHRFDAHLRQHTIQLEKTLEQLGKGPGEAKRLLRLVYRALAEVEGATLGAEEVGLEARRALAAAISERAEALAAWIARVHEIVQAAQAGEAERVRALLAHDARLANARSEEGISVLLSALYRGHEAVAAAARRRGRNAEHLRCGGTWQAGKGAGHRGAVTGVGQRDRA